MAVRGCVVRACLALILCGGAAARGEESERWRVPDGFTAELYADDTLVPDASAMTVDPQGRVVVAGPGYIKILIDHDADGRADSALTFDDSPLPAAEGLAYVESDQGAFALAVLRAGSLRLLYDRDRDDRVDVPREAWQKEVGVELVKLSDFQYTGNSLRAEPDGALYVACSAGEQPIHFGNALSLKSPIRWKPAAGVILRVSWQTDRWAGGPTMEMFTGGERIIDILADGFCDPHGLDFHPAGNLLTVDADNEQELGLPWHAPLRLFDVAEGRDHGWLKNGARTGWNRPGYFVDSVAPAAEMGSGVPSELTVYRHRQFPERYRGGAFIARWDSGRVDYVPLETSGSTLRGKPEKFFETRGEVGLAPIDLAVGRSGDLFIACGGRNTRGAVVRIRHASGHAALARKELQLQPADGVPPSLDWILNADQPNAAWSRRQWLYDSKQLGPGPFHAALVNPNRTPAEQIRAVEIISELFHSLPTTTAKKALDLKRPELSARLAWLMQRSGASSWKQTLSELTFDPDPRVQLAAWNAYRLAPSGVFSDGGRPAQLPNWTAAESDPRIDARVRAVIAATAQDITPPSLPAADDPNWQIKRDALHQLRFSRTEQDWIDRFAAAKTREQKLRAIRDIQINLGDFPLGRSLADEPFPGYRLSGATSARKLADSEQQSKLLDRVPSGDPDLDREILRTLSAFPAWPQYFSTIETCWSTETDPVDDLHYLICTAVGERQLAAGESWRRSVAAVLVGLDAKLAMRGIRVESEWHVVVERLAARLIKPDPALSAAIVEHPDFGRAAHAIFVAHLKRADAKVAAQRILAKAAADPETHWTPMLIDIVASTEDRRANEMLRKLWKDPSLQPSLFQILLIDDRPDDLPKFVECLTSPRPEIVHRAAFRLRRGNVKHTPEQLAAAVRGLRQMCSLPEARSARDALATLIGEHAGRSFTIVEPTARELERSATALRDAYQPIFLWYALEHYQAASAERSPGGVDPKAWRKRLLVVDWEEGVAARGEKLFVKKQCHRCHSPGGNKLGPDLAGAAKRYSRSDLFATVFEPSRFVPPAYRPTTFELKNGREYTGIPIYDSSAVALVQTGADTTVRIFGSDVAARLESTKSIMPLGLLDDLQPGDFADLYAFLKSLDYGTKIVEEPKEPTK